MSTHFTCPSDWIVLTRPIWSSTLLEYRVVVIHLLEQIVSFVEVVDLELAVLVH